jgi:hypothetical protein
MASVQKIFLGKKQYSLVHISQILTLTIFHRCMAVTKWYVRWKEKINILSRLAISSIPFYSIYLILILPKI